MGVLILVSVIVILLVSWAIASRINWFGLLEFNKKYSDGKQQWVEKYINGGLPYNAHAEIVRADNELSVINDGYGNASAPYEVWEQSANQLEKKRQDVKIDYDDYEDVEGWLNEDDVARKVRNIY